MEAQLLGGKLTRIPVAHRNHARGPKNLFDIHSDVSGSFFFHIYVVMWSLFVLEWNEKFRLTVGTSVNNRR